MPDVEQRLWNCSQVNGDMKVKQRTITQNGFAVACWVWGKTMASRPLRWRNRESKVAHFLTRCVETGFGKQRRGRISGPVPEHIVAIDVTQVRSPAQTHKAGSTLRSSRAVPHPSTNRALRRLASEVGRDPVYSTRYGRQRNDMAQAGMRSYVLQM